MALGRDAVEAQSMDLAAKTGGLGLTFAADKLAQHSDRFEFLLERGVERDLAKPLVDLRLGHGQAGVIGWHELDDQHVRSFRSGHERDHGRVGRVAAVPMRLAMNVDSMVKPGRQAEARTTSRLMASVRKTRSAPS